MSELMALVSGLIERHWEIIDLLLVTLGLVIYVTVSHTLHQCRHPSAAIAWVLGIVLLFFVTLPLYLAFGSRKVVPPRLGQAARRVAVSASANHTTAVRVQQLGVAMGLPDPVSYEGLTIHEDGTQALQALRRIINEASRSLEVSIRFR